MLYVDNFEKVKNIIDYGLVFNLALMQFSITKLFIFNDHFDGT